MENLKKIIACFSFVIVLILIIQFYYFLPKYDLYNVIRGQQIVTEDFAKDNDVLYEELRREGVFAAANLTIEKNWIYKNKTILLNFPASISSQRIRYKRMSMFFLCSMIFYYPYKALTGYIRFIFISIFLLEQLF